MSGAVDAGAVALEVAVTSPVGARAARDGGADRVELSTALELGGLTPSLGALQGCLEVDGALDVHVLVRPRPGDFVYDADELRTALLDVAHAVGAGAAGVVVGALTPAGELDTDHLAAAVAVARSVRPDADVTLHRAVDQLARPAEHVARLAALGVTRVLTSGGAASAPEGVDELARAVAAGRAAGGVEVMAGGGVGPASVAALVGAGVAAVHLSAKRAAAARLPTRTAVGAGPAGAPGAAAGAAAGDAHWVTDADVVAATRAALDAALSAAAGTPASGRAGRPAAPPR